jgi:asparagine synthase (glutamine-hydrolysing)
MCGIDGLVNFSLPVENGEKIVEMMNDSLSHRGPDDEGIFISGDRHVVLGNRRLSIVDIELGAQPVVVTHDGHEYSITCNGEIYNYREIRGELEKKGHAFKTNSDTEVVLRAYIEWGIGCINGFNGQFAFAVYDGKYNAVYLVRDRVGIKPLYYTVVDDGTLVFSSEPKAILIHPDLEKAPDNETIADFFLGVFSFTDGSASLDRSFFQGIYSLDPGTYAIFNGNRLKTEEYWDVSIHKEEKDEKRVTESFREKLEAAIATRIPDEVEFGTALSGGLDSSIVTAVVESKQDNEIISACIRFRDSGNNPDYEHAKIFAGQKNINLLTADLTAEEIISYIDPMIRAMDEPHDTIRQLGLFAVYGTLKKAGCKVVLVGEGSDEFNMGYYYNYPGFYRDRETISDSEGFRAILRTKIPQISRYFTEEFLASVDFDKIIDHNVTNYYDACDSEDPMDKMQYLYTKKFLKYRLDANDRCSMAHSVEARVPFCDHDVVGLSLRIPNGMNLKDNKEKCVLREAFRKMLPREIAERSKYPLPESDELLLHRLIAEELDGNIRTAKPGIWKILDKESIVELNERFKGKIGELEKEGKGGSELTKEIPMGEETGIKVKHVFSILTLIRWFEINFNG